MTSAPVRDVMYGMESVSHANTAKKTETAQEKEHDFRMIMNQAKNQAKQTVHQPNEEKVEKKDISQSKDTYKAEDEYEMKETPKKEDFRSEEAGKNKSDKLNNVSEAEPIDEEVETAVEGIVKEVMQEIEEMLEVSEEELLDVLEQLGLQPIDLFNPDNMVSILTALTGEGSTIQLVMDEEMYLTLQDLMQMVEDKTQELMSATGLSDEELEAVMDQLKLLMNQQLSHEEMEMKQVQILPFESEEEVVAEDGDVPVIVKNENDLQDVQTTEVTQDSPERIVEKTETGKSEDSLFQEQQQNMQSFQNMSDEISQLAGESKLEGTGTPNTESILKQLADYVKIQKGKELTEMELQLHPASLGNVKVTLATKGGVVTAQLTTENEIVKNAIESQVSQLKQNLEEQGVRVEAIEVSVASHQMERNLEQNAKDGEQEQKQETGGIHKIRKTSINLNSFEDADELLEEMTGADDATRIAMEMMAMGGNRMDLLA